MLFYVLLIILAVITVLVADRNFAHINKDNGNLPYALLCGCILTMAGVVLGQCFEVVTGEFNNNDQMIVLMLLACSLPLSIIYSVAKA